jgi:hypothetical protein
MSVANKQNITIVIGEYTDRNGQAKKEYRTIGELITMQDGSQFGRLWGPAGATKFSVYDKPRQDAMANAGAQQPQQQYQQAPPVHHAPQQGGYPPADDQNIPF